MTAEEYTAGKTGIAPRPSNSCLGISCLEVMSSTPQDSITVVREALERRTERRTGTEPSDVVGPWQSVRRGSLARRFPLR